MDPCGNKPISRAEFCSILRRGRAAFITQGWDDGIEGDETFDRMTFLEWLEEFGSFMEYRSEV